MEFDNDKTFYTETMARLLTQQGRVDRAVEVYRYLLNQNPHRKDLEQALDTLLSAVPEETMRWERVRGQVERWATLMLRYKTLRQLQRLSLPPTEDDRPGI